MPSLPAARGPLTEALFAHWATGSGLTDHPALAPDQLDRCDALVDDDLHLALWCGYALHYQGFDELAPDLEWDPETIGFRRVLEQRFEAALRDEHQPASVPADPVVALRVIATWAGPPLARTIEDHGTRNQVEEFAIHRSSYQLKEADSHTWGLPRLAGPGRAAMIEIQADEYGDGRPGEAHAELFADAMAELGLRTEFGHYVDRLPGVTLATDNLVSMFGLNRRLRGALVGHLALFEMCSVTPMSRYLAAARRLGGLPALERFYAVHVEADVHHARLALDEMVAPMTADQPELSPDVIFGAAALSRVEARFARHVLRSWDGGDSSLLSAVAPAASPIEVAAPVARSPRHATPMLRPVAAPAA